ncbi:MAG: siderophore-interacting protein [Rhizobiaceae bacterium]
MKPFTCKKNLPRLLTVKSAEFLTPNMRRITFAGPELEGIPQDRAGGNCKIMIPEPDEPLDAFKDRLENGPAPARRTFTVRATRSDPLEMDIDFVAHGKKGPASRWALEAKPGSYLGFAGPSTSKVAEFFGDWYLIAADPSALPVASAALEAMPNDAKGIAIFEVTHEDDRQILKAPEGIHIHWLVHPDPKQPSQAQEQLIRSLDWPSGRVQTCIAGESGVIRSLRAFLHQEKELPRGDTYISGYWKIGLVEDQHQAEKRAEG